MIRQLRKHFELVCDQCGSKGIKRFPSAEKVENFYCNTSAASWQKQEDGCHTCPDCRGDDGTQG
jgi:hypothetical protein